MMLPTAEEREGKNFSSFTTQTSISKKTKEIELSQVSSRRLKMKKKSLNFLLYWISLSIDFIGRSMVRFLLSLSHLHIRQLLLLYYIDKRSNFTIKFNFSFLQAIRDFMKVKHFDGISHLFLILKFQL